MSLVLPEDLAAEMVALLEANSDLARFKAKVEVDGRTTDQVLVDTTANANKGAIWIVHADRTTEQLGVSAGTSYTIIDQFDILVVDGRKNFAATRTALQAIDQTLREVLLPSASGRISPLTGWKRVNDPEADTVRAYVATVQCDFDDLMPVTGIGEFILDSNANPILEG